MDELDTTRIIKNRLALIDFDGTITKRDSFLAFLKFRTGSFQYYFKIAFLLPYIGLFKLGKYRASKLKEVFLFRFLKGKNINVINSEIEQFFRTSFSKLIHQEAIKKIEWMKTNGYRVIVVSANIAPIVETFCRRLNIEWIATEIKLDRERIQGSLESLNCKGPEKVSRILNFLDLSHYTEILAWGDSESDSSMIALSTVSSHRNFSSSSWKGIKPSLNE